MVPIIIDFTPGNLGRVVFAVKVMTSDRKSLRSVMFKLDSGSDFTTLSVRALAQLGYTNEFLRTCPFHSLRASTASGGSVLPLQYISNVSIVFGDRELQGCRIYFALGTTLRSLFGSDILKYFNREIDYDSGELRLTERINMPQLSQGEAPIQIYSVE